MLYVGLSINHVIYKINQINSFLRIELLIFYALNLSYG